MSDPTFSLVIPTYDVAAYLPAFLESLAGQTFPIAEVDPIFVIDGSPDDCATSIRAWAARAAPHATIIEQENGGLSAARNRGLAQARGTWVTFCDPDDVLAADYLEQVNRYAASESGAQADLLACYITILDDATAQVIDRHALRRRFTTKPQLVDLTREPDRLHLQSASAFYRRDLIEKLGLRFDSRIRPNFEDAAFTARYLWSIADPQIAFLPDAQYFYRKRANGTSLVQRSWTRPEKYLNVPRHGYLELLQDLRQARGTIPPWVQNLVLYDLFGYYREDDRTRSLIQTVSQTTLDEFWCLQAEALRMLDPWAIESFRVTSTTEQIRFATEVAAGLSLPRQVWAARIDAANQTVELRYVYRGEPPDERLISRGRPVRAIWGKHRTVSYFGRDVYSERIAWVSATGTIAVELDGERRPLVTGEPAPRDFRLGPTALWRELNDSAPPSNATTKTAKAAAAAPSPTPDPVPPSRHALTSAGGRLTRRLARRFGLDPTPSGPLWMLVDQPGLGGVGVRALANHLRDRGGRVKLVSVESSAHTDGLVWGSSEHRAALAEAAVLVSSPLDGRDVVPPETSWSGPYVSLTDGAWVTDRSRELDSAQLRLLAVTSRAQYDVVTGDGGRGRLTDREAEFSGLPLHDALRIAATANPDRLLFAPAHRDGGTGRTIDGGYLRPWLELLRDSVIARAWDEGLRPTVLLRREVDPALRSEIALCRVDIVDPDDDPLPVLADTAMVITDHDSVAVDLAALGRPVTYLHAIEDDYLSGRYGHRPSSWQAETDGFGPVAHDVAGAAANLIRLLTSGCRLTPMYAARIEADLVPVDGMACARIVAAIERVMRPMKHSEAYRPIR